MAGFTAQDVPDQSGRTILVTGANTGIGYEAARVLAGKGARVLLGCRDEGRGKAAVARISAQVPGADLGFVPLDQANLSSVRRAAEIVAHEPRLDVLLNNAGVMIPPLERTQQCFELQFGVNHLGTFALTGLLLPKLTQTAGSRVIITASIAHRRAHMFWGDLNAELSYQRSARYAQSKLANLLHLLELDRRLRASGSPLKAIGCHPGVAGTELMRHVPGFARALIVPVMNSVLNSPAKGAWPALMAATAQEVTPGGYYGPTQLSEMRGPAGPAKREPGAKDAAAAKRLWDISVELTGIDPGLPA